jgi:hypothetical protein
LYAISAILGVLAINVDVQGNMYSTTTEKVSFNHTLWLGASLNDPGVSLGDPEIPPKNPPETPPPNVPPGVPPGTPEELPQEAPVEVPSEEPVEIPPTQPPEL